MIGMMVAPGVLASTAFYWPDVSSGCRSGHSEAVVANLSTPPPLAGVHVMIQPGSAVRIRVVSFREEFEMGCELGFAVQGSNTCEDVPEVHVERLASNHDLFALELRAYRGELIDDRVQFTSICIR